MKIENHIQKQTKKLFLVNVSGLKWLCEEIGRDGRLFRSV